MESYTKHLSKKVASYRLEKKIFIIIILVMMSFNICMAIYSGVAYKDLKNEYMSLKDENTTLKIQNQTLEKVLENSCLVEPRQLQVA